MIHPNLHYTQCQEKKGKDQNDVKRININFYKSLTEKRAGNS
jgi:hypothetical protein